MNFLGNIMARLSTEQQTKINEVARRLVGDFGIVKLDKLVDYDRVKALRELAKQLRNETGTTYDTSRHKIAWACRRARHPKEQ